MRGDGGKGMYGTEGLHGVYEGLLSNGDTYKGPLVDGVPHGTGTIDGPTCTYVGDFHQGKKHGVGRCEYKKPSCYVYEGHFVNDQRHGRGKCIWQRNTNDECIIEGTWKDNEVVGKAAMYWPAKNSKYEGDIHSGARHGKGAQHFGNGCTFTGDWKDDFHTFGTMSYPDGTQYTGPFFEGNMHGKGSMVFGDGLVYQGVWESGTLVTRGECSLHAGSVEIPGTWPAMIAVPGGIVATLHKQYTENIQELTNVIGLLNKRISSLESSGPGTNRTSVTNLECTAADAERTAADAERTAADAERTAADAERTAADAERTAADAERTANPLEVLLGLSTQKTLTL